MARKAVERNLTVKELQGRSHFQNFWTAGTSAPTEAG